jgi:hypothetical protein
LTTLLLQPGEELCVSYFGDDAKFDFDRVMLQGWTKKRWKQGADKERRKTLKKHQCFCESTSLLPYIPLTASFPVAAFLSAALSSNADTDTSPSLSRRWRGVLPRSDVR